jgi:hypothetical protein
MAELKPRLNPERYSKFIEKMNLTGNAFIPYVIMPIMPVDVHTLVPIPRISTH